MIVEVTESISPHCLWVEDLKKGYFSTHERKRKRVSQGV